MVIWFFVYFKSLMLKGFKFFVVLMILCFELGIMVVVGFNGFGKFNVVDVLVWVMGE